MSSAGNRLQGSLWRLIVQIKEGQVENQARSHKPNASVAFPFLFLLAFARQISLQFPSSSTANQDSKRSCSPFQTRILPLRWNNSSDEISSKSLQPHARWALSQEHVQPKGCVHFLRLEPFALNLAFLSSKSLWGRVVILSLVCAKKVEVLMQCETAALLAGDEWRCQCFPFRIIKKRLNFPR